MTLGKNRYRCKYELNTSTSRVKPLNFLRLLSILSTRHSKKLRAINLEKSGEIKLKISVSTSKICRCL